MAFKFKLQPLLKHRTLLENLARQALAEAMSNEAAMEQAIEKHRQICRDLEQEFEQKKSKGMVLQELLIYERSLKRQAEKLKQLRAEAASLHTRTEQQRAHLTESSKDRTLMEKLKTKREDEYRQDMLRQEMNDLDEIALLLGKQCR
jgi:flagellar FliJ protein